MNVPLLREETDRQRSSTTASRRKTNTAYRQTNTASRQTNTARRNSNTALRRNNKAGGRRQVTRASPRGRHNSPSVRQVVAVRATDPRPKNQDF